MLTDFAGIFENLIKLLFIIAGGVYLVFAVVVIRQIFIMEKSLVTSFSKELKLIGFIHLGLAILVMLFFIVSL